MSDTVIIIVGAGLLISGAMLYKDGIQMRRTGTFVSDILYGRLCMIIGMLTCAAGFFITVLGVLELFWKGG